jgi:hypothetical protein
MRRQLGLVGIIGFFGLHAVAVAQAQSPPPVTARAVFDGTYQVVSSTRVNQTYVQRGGMTGFCPEATPGALVIAQNRISYTTESGRRLDGIVGPAGEIDMRYAVPTTFQPTRINVFGRVDTTGTVRLRQEGNSCSYDLIWQKRS